MHSIPEIVTMNPAAALDDERPAGEISAEKAELLRHSLQFLSDPSIERDETGWHYLQVVGLDDSLVADTDLYIHWGASSEWTDQEVMPEELLHVEPGKYVVRVRLLVESAGSFGATLYAKHSHSSERLWQGRPSVDDVYFSISLEELADSVADAAKTGRMHQALDGTTLEKAVESYEAFASHVHQSRKSSEHRALGRSLFQFTYEEPELRQQLSEYLSKARQIVATSRVSRERKHATEVIEVLQRLGIGEIVLISPEGPHASAGGLSQVITGLLTALSEGAMQATLISPLYDLENGKKHSSAEELIRRGVPFDGKRLPLKPIGDIFVRFGPTRDVNDGSRIRFAQRVPVKVYLAEGKNIRLILLHHRRLSDALYRGVWADEQIRRSVFLSQGALEVMSRPEFGVTPHMVISNDWMTGLVPALMQSDPRYRENPILRDAETIHIIHNGGRGYQGKFNTVQYSEDLFPLLGLPGHHYFGISDPIERNCFNFTAAAVFHVRQAILTVSTPYAKELLTPGGGEGLESLYRRRRRVLFGISNGIDRYAIRKGIWERGLQARGEERRATAFRDSLYVQRLPALKQSLKDVTQGKYGLEQRPGAILICLVGRLAEQKGIKLLTEEAIEGDTVLSYILRSAPETQLLICGPRTENDSAFDLLSKHTRALSRAFPGRIATSFEFIPHLEALEITAGSDLFLMPSRYEPGGISQLEALAVGTPVVARNVGGLQATLKDLSDSGGNAFLFERYTAQELMRAVERAVGGLRNPEIRYRTVREAAQAQNDWSDRMPSYLALFRFIAGVSDPFHPYPYLRNELDIVESIRASRT